MTMHAIIKDDEINSMFIGRQVPIDPRYGLRHALVERGFKLKSVRPSSQLDELPELLPPSWIRRDEKNRVWHVWQGSIVNRMEPEEPKPV
jgi:hypothetical protein